MAETLLPTTVVGSYPQPDWLVDRALLIEGRAAHAAARAVARARPAPAAGAGRRHLLAIRDMERAGIDIITDGEIRRESYSNRFATALDGVDNENPAEIVNNRGRQDRGAARRRPDPPHAAGRGARRAVPARATPTRAAKITLPGPFTMAQQAQDEFYKDDEAMAMDYAAAVNEEVRELSRRRRRRDPARRAVAAQRSRRGASATPSRRSTGRSRASPGRPSCISASAMPPWSPGDKPTGYSFLPQLADTHRRADLDRGGAAQARSRRAEGPRRQDRDARRHRSRRPGGRDAGDGRRAHPRRR